MHIDMVGDFIKFPLVLHESNIIFPKEKSSFQLDNKANRFSIESALRNDGYVFVTGTDTEKQTLYPIGTVCRVIHSYRDSGTEGSFVTLEGFQRAFLHSVTPSDKFSYAEVSLIHDSLPDDGGVESTAYCRELMDELMKFVLVSKRTPVANVSVLDRVDDAGYLSDHIAHTVFTKLHQQRKILEITDPFERAEEVINILRNESEVEIVRCHVQQVVNDRMNENQKEYFLRESIKAMQDELSEGGNLNDYSEQIESKMLPEEVKEKLLKENARLSHMPTGSPDAMVLINYIETCLEIPYNVYSKEKLKFDAVQITLDKDHDGLEKVKDRIVEYIAARQYSPELSNQVLCLVGPPGVGKTSIGASIARAIGRKYQRISLGGVRDEADIRGHRKTYVGAMPGRIIRALTLAGTSNPLILLDEIDKMGQSYQGDPTSALLEVLDGEQNKAFRDHFVELPVDLSHVMFLATANNVENIPKPLIDRMEMIYLDTYTKREKISIAKNHLIPKQLKRHNLTKSNLKITDDALVEIIDYYTHEAGVRNLERTIASLCRKTAKKLLSDHNHKIVINQDNLKDFLGERKSLPETISEEDRVGIVNGLAYTEIGGTMLPVEAVSVDGTGEIKVTGSLGDVMKESAQIAITVARTLADEYGIDKGFFKSKDLHLHFPEGAIPKDGPSAGVTIVTALVSELTHKKVKRDVAMTGEISLHGQVLPIGGLKEKTMAAYSAGVKTVLIPFDNQKDLSEIDPMARNGLQFIPCRNIRDVLSNALVN